MSEFTTIRLDAGHDRNGTPRRVFVVIDGWGNIAGAFSEGYSGSRAMPEEIRDTWDGLTFQTTPGEYRSLMRGFGETWYEDHEETEA